MSGSQGMHSPVAQFEIKPLIELSFGGYDLSFTNSSLFMMLAIGVSAAFLISAMRRGELVPGRMQGLAEMMYEFVAEMVRSNVGHEGRPYFPFIFTLFVFLLFGNMLGLIPYSYTFTSQIVVTFAMAAFVFVGVTLIALFKHGLHFFSFFVPAGAPKVLIPFLIVIEVISYFVRPVSLSVRLFANMLAGHTMLESVRWSRGDDFRRGRFGNGRIAIAIFGVDWPDWPRSFGGRFAGLCIHYLNLHVFK